MPAFDTTLWNRFLAGEEQAFETIFQLHYRELYGYGLRLTSDEDLTKDCIQNLFQRLWNRRQHLGTIAEIKPYLFTSMRHEVGAEIKAQQRRNRLESAYPPEFEIQYSPEDFIIAQQLSAEQHTQLLAALGRLSNRQREAIYLKFFDGFDYERISQIMELNQQSVRNLVYQGIRLLRQSLALPLLLFFLSGQLSAAVRSILKISF